MPWAFTPARADSLAATETQPAERAAGRTPALVFWVFLAAIALYLLLTALLSARRLWHDELFTLYIATAPTWPRFLQALHIDLNPPLQYFAVRISTLLFGTGPYAVRLPSIMAFLGGSLCLAKFVARWLGAEYGFFAMLVLWASPFFYYSTEARPYALLTGFLGATLLAWQWASEREGRAAVPVLVLFAAVSGMMLSHLMGVLYVTPFCLAELVQQVRGRRVRIGLWAALVLPCAIPFIYSRMLARVGTTAFPPVFQASLRKIAESYYGSLKIEAIPLLGALLLALLLSGSGGRQRREGGRPILRWPELALTAGLLALPALVNVALMLMHGAYFDRYALPVVFGYALGLAWFLAYQTGADRTAALAGGAVLLLFFCGFNGGPGLKDSVWARRNSAPDSGKAIAQIRPDLPLVAASGLTFLEMDHYESAATIARLYYLTDRGRALRYAHATIFESLPSLKREFPIRAHCAPFETFTAAHRQFLVLGTPDYPEDWLLRALLATPANVRYLGTVPSQYKDNQIYEVTMP